MDIGWYDIRNRDSDGFFVLKPTRASYKMLLNREHEDKLIFRHSHVAITNFNPKKNEEFLKSLSVFDQTKWTYRRMAGYYVPELHEFRVPRGYNTGLLAKFFPHHRPMVDNGAYPDERSDAKLMVGPRDDMQKAALSFLCSQGEFRKNAQFTVLLVDAAPGFGKTWSCIAASCFMHARVIVISPIAKLLDQWRESFLKFTDMKEDEVLIVQGSKACDRILDGKCKDVKAFIFSTDTVISYQKARGNLATIDMFHSTGAYLKVIDEVHLEMKANSMIEALCNTRMTFYASASPTRSDRKGKWIFSSCYHNVPRFSNYVAKVKEDLYLDIMVVPYRFIPTVRQIKRMVHPRTGWLNSNSYEKEVFGAAQSGQSDLFSRLERMLQWTKMQLKENNRVLILVESIEGTAIIQEIAERVFPGETSRYYGTGLSKTEKAEALEKRIIVATSKSMGTGADVAGFQHIYALGTYSNVIAAIQKPGRGRKLADGTQVVYIEFVNFTYAKTAKQFETRKGELMKMSRTGNLIWIN